MPAAPSSVRIALAVRPCRPITLPRSSGCTFSSSTVTCAPSPDFTCTSSGWSTRARAMVSTSSFMDTWERPRPDRGAKFRKALWLGDLLQLQEAAHGIARLCALPQPILDALRVQLDLRRLLQRIVRAHRFLHAAVPRPGPFNHHHAVKGLFLLTNPRQPNR